MDTKTAIAKLREGCPKELTFMQQKAKERQEYKEEMEENKHFISENNKTTLAQVFTDIRYTTANNIHFSKEFMNVLKRQGFVNE